MRLTLLAVVALVATGGSSATIDLDGVTRLAGRPVEGAVVWVDAPAGPRPAKQPDAVLNQRDIRFFPHVLAVQVGTKVRFPNADRVFHNVFSFHDGKRFDLGLYPVGTVKEVPFDTPGVSRVFCNIHTQMAAYVVVVETPFFAVSDNQGRFTIAAVPRGTHRYYAWRPGGAILHGEIDPGREGPFEVNWP